MIIVGIDFGDARTGIAVCDKYEMMASEAGCVKADSYKKALAAVSEKVVELKEELFNVRFQMATGQLENPMQLKQVRKDIARAKTVIREREIAAQA